MKQVLPKNASKIVERYKNLKIGPHTITTPYFQNFNRPKRSQVYSGKSLPEAIEEEAIKLFSKKGKDIKDIDPSTIKLYLVMAGLGVDCSGFAVRVLDELLKEQKNLSVRQALKPLPQTLPIKIRFWFRPYMNLSSDAITSELNCVKIELQEVKPGDMVRFGDSHLAIVTSVEKENGKVSKLEYHHSTSDYLDEHGVRKGTIEISNQDKPLEHQKWTEIYQGKNWTYEDYKRIKSSHKGLRRLRVLT